MDEYSEMVLRLFSMFPAGAPGVGLLILRVSLALSILQTAPHGMKASIATLVSVFVAALSLVLCLGIMTPIVSVSACFVELICLFVSEHVGNRSTVLSSANAIAISLLGPGAYSIDAKLFGRREIVRVPGETSSRG